MSPACTGRRVPLRMVLPSIWPSVSAVAVPAVMIHRSAVPSSWISGGSSGRTMRTLALALYGALNNREFATFFASLFFHRFWTSSLVQNLSKMRSCWPARREPPLLRVRLRLPPRRGQFGERVSADPEWYQSGPEMPGIRWDQRNGAAHQAARTKRRRDELRGAFRYG